MAMVATSSTANKDTAEMDIFKITAAFGGCGLLTLSASGFWVLLYQTSHDSFFAWMAGMMLLLGGAMTSIVMLPDRE